MRRRTFLWELTMFNTADNRWEKKICERDKYFLRLFAIRLYGRRDNSYFDGKSL